MRQGEPMRRGQQRAGRTTWAALAAATAFAVAGLAAQPVFAQVTWDGVPDGGVASSDTNWSTATNWVGDLAPAATENRLVLGAAGGRTATHVVVISLINGTGTTDGSITFAAGAGSFTL